MTEEQQKKVQGLRDKLVEHYSTFHQCRTFFELIRGEVSVTQSNLKDTLKEINFLSKTQTIAELKSLLDEIRHEAEEMDEYWNIDFVDVMNDIHNLTSIEDVPESRIEPSPDSRNLDV